MENKSQTGDAKQLEKLSQEVMRIASALEQLAGRQSPAQNPHSANEQLIDIPAQMIEFAIRARRDRSQYLPSELFADPAWDMMLELLRAEITQRRVSVSSLCHASGVPATTALRWITNLVKKGIFVRRPDQLDGRRFFVELSPEVSSALRGYFAALANREWPARR